jgi:hypothetical protein
MNDDLDSKLRDALRPVPPRGELTELLIARLAGRSAGESAADADAAAAAAAPATAAATGAAARVARVSPVRRLQRPVWWLPVGLAASLLLAVGIQRSAHEREQREKGLEARRQVFEALRVTNQKLDVVYRAVRDESKS